MDSGSGPYGPRKVLEGKGNVIDLFWSPGGDYVGYWTGTLVRGYSLWKVPALGGTPVPLCTLTPGLSMAVGYPASTWSADGRIIIATAGDSLSRPSPGLYEASALVGEARVILKMDPTLNEQWFGRPFFLPDGQTVLFAVE